MSNNTRTGKAGSKTRAKAIGRSKARSVDSVVLIGREPLDSLGIEGGKGLEASATKPLKVLEKEWNIVTQQVGALLDKTDAVQSKRGFALEEVTFELGINASGQIGFIVGAEVGGHASITLTFRKSKPN